MAPGASDRLLRQIAEDHRSGATALTRRAGEALLAFLKERPGASPEELGRFAEGLVEAQPAMASIRNLARHAREAARRGGPSAVRAAVEAFLEELARSPVEIAERALPLIPRGARVLTTSFSATVFEALRRAHEAGKGIFVVCPESRPLREGLRLARELAALGVPVEVCVDALAPSLVGECDLVVVGGDALAPEGLVNKCGTYALALAASSERKPFVALISELKVLERFEPKWAQRAMPPDEVLEAPLEGVRVRNAYFDLTPLARISTVVTERGAFRPEPDREALRRRLRSP